MAGLINNQILEANLKKIHCSDATRQEILSHTISGRVQIGVMPGGQPVMKYDGADLYDPQQPMAAIVQDIQKLVGDREQDAVVFMGMGLGIHAEFLKKRFDAPLIVFEPDLDILKTALGCRPLQLEETTIETNFGRLFDLLDKCLEPTDRRVIAAAMPSYKYLFKEALSRFQFAVQQALDNISIRQNTMVKGMSWSEHESANLVNTTQCPPIELIRNNCQNVPGIFVGAGPSLDKNIAQLKKAKGRALIIASNSSVKPLCRAGIVPDIVAIIEAKDLLYQFDGIDQIKDLTIAPTPNANPKFWDLPVKHKLSLLTCPSPVNDWIQASYDNRMAVIGGGSVALVAFAALHGMGCDPIIGVGMDLAYTEGASHVSGSDHAAIRVKHDDGRSKLTFSIDESAAHIVDYESHTKDTVGLERDMESCTAWGGEGSVMTYVVFNSYRAWLEGAAETWAGDRMLINATEGGARIYGFTEMALKDAVDKYCHREYAVEKWIDEAVRFHQAPNLAPMRTTLLNELDNVRKVAELSKQCARHAHNSIGFLQKPNLEKARRELEKLSQKESHMGELTRLSRTLNQVTQAAASAIRLGRHEDKDPDELRQTINSLNRSIRLFKKISEGTQSVEELFTASLKNINDVLNS